MHSRRKVVSYRAGAQSEGRAHLLEFCWWAVFLLVSTNLAGIRTVVGASGLHIAKMWMATLRGQRGLDLCAERRAFGV